MIGPDLRPTNPEGFRGRYILNSAVVGQVGLAELDDGSIYVVFLGTKSQLRLHEVRAPRMRRES